MNPFEALTHTTAPSPQMDPSTNVALPVVSWIERPLCHCGHRAKIGTSTKRATLGRRFFECPDLDDDFMPCKFKQWIDVVPSQNINRRTTEVESKTDYLMRKAEHERMHQAPQHTQHERMPHAPQLAQHDMMHRTPQLAQHDRMHQAPNHIPGPTPDELYDQHDREQEEYFQRSAAATLQRMHETDQLSGRPTNPAIEQAILQGFERIRARIREQELIDFELHGQRVARWREQARRNKRNQ